MHPIERLRFVARSRGAPADLLVAESATALGAFRGDPAGMVAACRRIIDRQITCGPLWWLCAHLLCDPEPMAAARRCVDEVTEDPTAALLAAEVPDGATVVTLGWPEQLAPVLRRRGDLTVLVVDVDDESYDVAEQLEARDVRAEAVRSRNAAAAVASADMVLLECSATGPSNALVPAGSVAAALVARHHEVPVWLAAGAGRLLPASMFDALAGRWASTADPADAPEELLGLDLVDRIAGVTGVQDPATALAATDCPVAPELFRLAG